MTKLTTPQLTLLHALAAAPQPAPTKIAEPKLHAAAEPERIPFVAPAATGLDSLLLERATVPLPTGRSSF